MLAGRQLVSHCGLEFRVTLCDIQGGFVPLGMVADTAKYPNPFPKGMLCEMPLP